MTPLKRNPLDAAIAVLATGTTALGSQLPGISFFTNYAPPHFGPLKLMTGGLTLAIFTWVFFSSFSKSQGVKAGVVAIISAIILAVVYTAILDLTTVSVPPERGEEQRFQIGFGLASFSLTKKGLDLVKASPDGATPEDLMLATGGFRPNGADLVWKPWTIRVAWALLSTTFLLGYVTWSFGLANIARHLKDQRQ